MCPRRHARTQDERYVRRGKLEGVRAIGVVGRRERRVGVVVGYLSLRDCDASNGDVGNSAGKLRYVVRS